jgi:hypothetical protein
MDFLVHTEDWDASIEWVQRLPRIYCVILSVLLIYFVTVFGRKDLNEIVYLDRCLW